jgi:hypothetical protein
MLLEQAAPFQCTGLNPKIEAFLDILPAFAYLGSDHAKLLHNQEIPSLQDYENGLEQNFCALFLLPRKLASQKLLNTACYLLFPTAIVYG